MSDRIVKSDFLFLKNKIKSYIICTLNIQGEIMTKYQFNSIYKKWWNRSTGLLFIKVYNKWESNLKESWNQLVLLCLNLSFWLRFCFCLIERNVTQVDIARFTGMDVMTVSQIVRLLEKKDYIRRDQHPKDSRAKLVSVTKSGARRSIKLYP